MNQQSIFSKIRSITLGNLHSLLDFAKSLNTVADYEQYLRDLRTGRDQLDKQAAAGRGRKKFLDQQIATAKARCSEADEQINLLLGDDDPSNDHFANPLQVQYDSIMKQIEAAEAELVTVSQVVSQYDEAVQRIDVRYVEADAKLSTIRLMEQGTNAKEKAAKALDGLDFGSAPDTTGAEARLAERASVADNALSRSLDRMSGAIGGATTAEAAAAAAIAKRRAAISAKKASEPQSA